MKYIILVLWLLLAGIIVGYGQEVPAPNAIFASPITIEQEPALYDVVSLSPYQLLTGSIEVGEEKVVFAPFKLFPGYIDVLSEFRLNIAREDNITTYGGAISWNPSAPGSARGKQELEDVATDSIGGSVTVNGAPGKSVYLIPKRPPNPGEPVAEYQQYSKAYDRFLKENVYVEYYKRLSRNILIPTLAYNVQTFETLPVKDVDADENGQNDNEYFTKAWDGAISLIYTFEFPMMIGAAVHYSEKRESPEEGSLLVPHFGASVSIGGRLVTLDEDYRKSDAYLDNLFIPALVGGLAFEWQRCNGNEDQCADKIRLKSILTPYLDFNIAPQAQFRLGLGIEWQRKIIGTNPVNILPVLQYSLQFAAPSK